MMTFSTCYYIFTVCKILSVPELFAGFWSGFRIRIHFWRIRIGGFENECGSWSNAWFLRVKKQKKFRLVFQKNFKNEDK